MITSYDHIDLDEYYDRLERRIEYLEHLVRVTSDGRADEGIFDLFTKKKKSNKIDLSEKQFIAKAKKLLETIKSKYSKYHPYNITVNSVGIGNEQGVVLNFNIGAMILVHFNRGKPYASLILSDSSNVSIDVDFNKFELTSSGKKLLQNGLDKQVKLTAELNKRDDARRKETQDYYNKSKSSSDDWYSKRMNQYSAAWT